MNDDNMSFDDEHDEYDDLLAKIGRTEDEDERIAIHEAGHAVAARLLGKPIGGATISPDQNGKYGGLVWGPRHSVAFGNDDDAADVPELCGHLRDLMPQDGEVRGDAADTYLHVLDRCIELSAASVAERMLLPGEPVPSVSDVEQAVALAALVCKSAEAVERFLAFCEQQARDLLRQHGPIIMALSIVLKIRRTLTGAEIDDVIATTVAGLQLAAERRRRAEWRKGELAAERFRSACDHPHAAALSRSAPDRMV
ncbi:zinc metalloprotease [Bradyrhizobium diazoefficiens]|uniref:hypothetical protein n=1 Tax=Bradyrhizobium diazoefficiens TaxID=1355477 RepID=UPI001B8BE4B4|nr:hypothetical protein [Bradyrhizobium diazoefficiens]MBR0867490.1 hypothetical protein [Bradyrhizobium diazoefficiens]MBR0891997.1 hypothetical protein [Bradyrhizobium diazoefficiens]MBR0923733.1 hypothetical protein [Bradyrhizobium diazoefficiens]